MGRNRPQEFFGLMVANKPFLHFSYLYLYFCFGSVLRAGVVHGDVFGL